jgi:benzil reductase ((S)-benzoin forming)
MAKHLTIITGSSRGMGLAMALQLLDSGHDLLCLARRPNAELDQQATARGRTCEQWAIDLTAPEDAARRLEQRLRQSDTAALASATLINNAGSLPHIAPVAAIEAGELARTLRLDLEAPVLLTSAFLRATQDWPVSRKVLNISSGLGRSAMASQAAYCTAKAGMDHFTRCVALEQASRAGGAKVCSLAPGVIDTDMQVQMRSAGDGDFPDQHIFARLKATGGLASPRDAAARVLAYLARPDFGANAVADVRD